MERYVVKRIVFDSLPLKVGLGCGQNCRPGYIGADFHDYGQGIVWNLEEGIPLPEGRT